MLKSQTWETNGWLYNYRQRDFLPIKSQEELGIKCGVVVGALAERTIRLRIKVRVGRPRWKWRVKTYDNKAPGHQGVATGTKTSGRVVNADCTYPRVFPARPIAALQLPLSCPLVYTPPSLSGLVCLCVYVYFAHALAIASTSCLVEEQL